MTLLYKNLSLYIKQIFIAAFIFLATQIILVAWTNNTKTIFNFSLVLISFISLILYISKKLMVKKIFKVSLIAKTFIRSVFFFFILLTVIAIFSALATHLGITPATPVNQSSLITILSSDPLSRIVMTTYICFFAPCIEEFCFRYLLIPLNLSTRFTFIGAIISITSFASLHMIGDFTNYFALVNYSIMSISFVLSYLITKDIWQNIANHIFWNTILLISNGFLSTIFVEAIGVLPYN